MSSAIVDWEDLILEEKNYDCITENELILMILPSQRK